MILYHGSNVIVNKPEIRSSNRFLDFGTGFYTTTNLNQAINFAHKVVKREKQGKATINIYNFEEKNLNKLNVLSFTSANAKWLDFVSNNRNGINKDNKYDLIFGPVADDDIYRTFLLYSNGFLTKKQTLETLKIKKLFNQYTFCTDKSLSYLEFIESKEVDTNE